MIVGMIANTIQLAGVCIPFVGCVSLLRKAQSRTSMYLLLANLGCLIINGSYLLFLQTTTDEGAVIALKMEYFGNVVFYLTFGLFLWSYLRLKRHRWARLLFLFWCVQDLCFLFCIWSGVGIELVFEDFWFLWDGNLGLIFMQSTPGVLYMTRYATICLILLCGMIYTIVRMFRVQIASERNNLAKLAGAQFVICMSLILMLLFNFSIDIVPICASLSILSIIISVRRDEFFGIAELGREWMLEQMGDAFVIVDEMYGYLDSSPYARKVFTELNYKQQNETVSGDMYRMFTNTEKIQQIYGKYYHKKVMEFRTKGEIVGYGLFLADITEQHELMERVRQEKERADAANQAKSAFVSNVSHEIRTPMNAIVGMTQIMLRRDLPKQDKEYLMNIRNSGNALLAIINDLLDMSKIEAGKMELVDEEYDFMTMLNDLGMIILNRIGNKPVELLFDIDKDIPAKLYGDALRIRQIIINLMNNATKFTEEGSVTLTVKVAQIEKRDIELFLSVKDTGQGIREEDIGRLFGSFQQVDVKKNHQKEGTGLGLSIVKQLVELMHGTIGVKSEYGKGSEFYFTIHQRIEDERKAAQIVAGQNAVIAGSMKNPAAQEMLRKLAQQYGLSYVGDMMTEDARALLSDKSTEVSPAKESGQEDRKEKGKIVYFTDRYDELGSEEKERLSACGAIICGLQNPMTESNLPEEILTQNKPLYSYSFCNIIEDKKNAPEAEDKNREAYQDTATGADETDLEFTAQGARVLIVDDNEINCMVAEEMLKPLQMQIELVSDGAQALKMVQESQYDMIFMDHLMPVMNGIEATKAIRALEGNYYQGVPIIALTGNTAREQQNEYLQAGMSDYLSKPIDMKDIFAMIRKWMPDKIQG
ncbi:MAG: ATP-binding protein [Blautia sp.]|nr:ATP-binding protein [Lachnoclostridium sp.]MCM1210533.1 ATP-binding protein [Blautia sp.]